MGEEGRKVAGGRSAKRPKGRSGQRRDPSRHANVMGDAEKKWERNKKRTGLADQNHVASRTSRRWNSEKGGKKGNKTRSTGGNGKGGAIQDITHLRVGPKILEQKT